MSGSQAQRRLPRLMSLGTIHQETGIPLSTLYDAAARREFPVVRLGATGRALRVAEADFLRWIERRREVSQ